jgi:hypothetical protein
MMHTVKLPTTGTFQYLVQQCYMSLSLPNSLPKNNVIFLGGSSLLWYVQLQFTFPFHLTNGAELFIGVT